MIEIPKGLIASCATIAALGSLAACSAEKEFDTRHSNKIHYVEIEDGAKLRTEPWVPGEEDPSKDTLLTIFRKKDIEEGYFEYKDQRVVISTPEGVEIHKDNNGVWYGIPWVDYKVSIYSDPIQKVIENDEDGIIWVSGQRAQRLKEKDLPELNN